MGVAEFPPARVRAAVRSLTIIIYYSGEGSKANPELTQSLGTDANVMLTFHDMHQAGKKKPAAVPTKRFAEILTARGYEFPAEDKKD